jgi:hypothetical protein
MLIVGSKKGDYIMIGQLSADTCNKWYTFLIWNQCVIEKCNQVKQIMSTGNNMFVNIYCLRAKRVLGLNPNVHCLPVCILVIKQYTNT